MSCGCASLEMEILRAFKQAVAEDRLDVAEHLLKAIETLQRNDLKRPSLAEAYLTIAHHPKPSAN